MSVGVACASGEGKAGAGLGVHWCEWVCTSCAMGVGEFLLRARGGARGGRVWKGCEGAGLCAGGVKSVPHSAFGKESMKICFLASTLPCWFLIFS